MFLDKIYRRVVFYKNDNFHILSYGLYYGIAFFFFFMILLTGLHVNNQPLTISSAIYVTLLMCFGLIFFAKILYLVYNFKRLFNEPFSVLNETGYVFFGGFIGILIMVYLIPINNTPKMELLDFTFLSLPIMQIFFRLGCASYGCCYGHPYTGPMAYVHPDKESKSRRYMGRKKIHPTQFYSLLKDIFLTIAVISFFIKFPHPGMAAALWMILYPMMRFFIDFTRDFTSRNIPYTGGFRISQLLCVPIFLAGIYLLFSVDSTVSYHCDDSIISILLQSLYFIPCALFASIISAICFSYHGPEIGHYIKVNKDKNSK